jgi:hypothetical protein
VQRRQESCSLTWWRFDFGAFELIDFRLHLAIWLHLIDELSKSLCLVGEAWDWPTAVAGIIAASKNGRNERKFWIFIWFLLVPERAGQQSNL